VISAVLNYNARLMGLTFYPKWYKVTKDGLVSRSRRLRK
jgi:hypothetical protein